MDKIPIFNPNKYDEKGEDSEQFIWNSEVSLSSQCLYVNSFIYLGKIKFT